MKDATTRFSNRVSDYIKYRPTYPAGVIDLLELQCGLSPGSTIADIGSGTGILAELLLKRGCTVYAVEPNQAMREAAETSLSPYPNFTSVAGKAEATTLTQASVNLIVAGQAFHWFDQTRCKSEFLRILRPDGWVALIWNERNTTRTSFSIEYEDLLFQLGTDYATVDHRHVGDGAMNSFFGSGKWRTASFPNYQRFDFEGLRGRCLSSSYTPTPGTTECEALVSELQTLFNRHASDGSVTFEYSTKVFYGRIQPPDGNSVS